MRGCFETPWNANMDAMKACGRIATWRLMAYPRGKCILPNGSLLFDTFSRSHNVDLMRSVACDDGASRANPNVARTFYVFQGFATLDTLCFLLGYHGL